MNRFKNKILNKILGFRNDSTVSRIEFGTLNFSKRKIRGFTLIELLLYAAGLVFLLVVITYLILQMHNLYRTLTLSSRADRVGITVVDRIVKDIRSGQFINLADSSLGVATGTLNLTTQVGNSDVVKEYAYDNGRISYQEDGGSIYYLSPDDISVSKFEFNQIVTPVSQAIRFELEINYNNKDQSVIKNYTGVSVMRRSYD